MMWRNRRVILAATLYISLLFHCILVASGQDIDESQEEALRSVNDLESRPDPLSPEERITRSPEHVVVLDQVGEDTYRVSTPQHPPQRINFLEEGNGHFIEALWIRRVGSNELLFYENVTEDPGTIETVFRPSQELLNETLRSQVRIQAYMWCNLHGLWVSPVLTMVPPIYWLLAAGENVEEECQTLPGVNVYTARQRASMFLSPAAEASVVLVHYSLPVGTYLGVGLNTEFFMIGTLALVARAADNPDVRLYDLVSREKSQVQPMPSPLPVVRNISVVNGIVEIVAEFAVAADKLDHKMMFAFGKLEGGQLVQHAEQGVINIPERGDIVTLTPRKLFDLVVPGQNSSFRACTGPIMATQCSSRTTNKRDVQLTHGVLMFIIWSFNITVGVFVARYERHTTWWLHVHKFLQLLCSITTIPVYVIGFVAAESTTHFSTMHGQLGLAIAAFSSMQVASGFCMYRSAKLSRRLLHYLVAHPDVPTELRESLVLDFEKNPQQTILLQKEFIARQDPSWLTLERQKAHAGVDLSKIICNFVMQHHFHDRIFYRYVVPIRRSVIIPLHHWQGRGLLIMVYVQMYVGVDLVNLEPFVQHCFYGWVAILALLFLYKEVLLQKRNLCRSSKPSGCTNTWSSSDRPQAKAKSQPNPGTSDTSSQRQSNGVGDEDEAARYTKSFFKDKRHHEKQILSIHNFVGNKHRVRTAQEATKQHSSANTPLPTTTITEDLSVAIEHNNVEADPESQTQKPHGTGKVVDGESILSKSNSFVDNS